MRGAVYTEGRREGAPMQMTHEARKHTRSKPRKRSAKHISVSTNPLFNHVYSTQVPSNNREHNCVPICIIDVMHNLAALQSCSNKKTQAGALIRFVIVLFMKTKYGPTQIWLVLF